MGASQGKAHAGAKEEPAIVQEEVVIEDKDPNNNKEVSASPEPAGAEDNPDKAVEPEQVVEEENEPAKAPEKKPEEAPEPSRDARNIKVHISGCRGVREMSWVPKAGSDMYIVVRLESSDDELFRTRMVKDEVWPTWKEEGEIGWTPGENLEFELMEVLYCTYDIKGQMKDEQTVVAGRGVLKSSDFASEGFNGVIKLDSRIHMETQLRVRVAAPGKDYPKDEPTEFTLTFDKAISPGKLGVLVDQTDGKTLCVRDVEKGGTVSKYNQQAPEGMRVRPHDFIMKVNGEEGDSAQLLSELGKDTKITMLIKRPMDLAMGIAPKQVRKVHGIEFSKVVDREWLLVTDVKPGTNASSYNETFQDNQILAGDRMVRAFGTQAGFGSDLARTALSSTSLQLEVFRPFDPKPPMSCWYSLGEEPN
mmetsp:Transcript_58386/g.170742  ORF Transcript_58386/g.170742 Transcript_58386/m.170742 type:complete len:419 (+) Transcript_58386:103-1359(+)